MSRAPSIVSTPVPDMDEDFDLCISETNLPFPYSDHCSTGPPSLYDYDMSDDEGGEEEDEENDQDSEERDDSEKILDELLENDDDDDDDSDENPSLTLSRLRSDDSDRPMNVADITNDISNQLYRRLERINNNKDLDKDRSGMLMASPTTTIASSRTSRPRSRRTYSYESNGEWQAQEDENLIHDQQIHDEDQQQSENGLISTVTSTVSSVAYAVGKHWSK
ncbi:hypothetical protein BGZ46_005447, partial [Entomortierella lignicola]